MKILEHTLILNVFFFFFLKRGRGELFDILSLIIVKSIFNRATVVKVCFINKLFVSDWNIQLNMIVGLQYSCDLLKVVHVYVCIKSTEINHIEATPPSWLGSLDPTLPPWCSQSTYHFVSQKICF